MPSYLQFIMRKLEPRALKDAGTVKYPVKITTSAVSTF